MLVFIRRVPAICASSFVRTSIGGFVPGHVRFVGDSQLGRSDRARLAGSSRDVHVVSRERAHPNSCGGPGDEKRHRPHS